MQMNMEALKALKLKLAEYSKENGAIAEHVSSNMNVCFNCEARCKASCSADCYGSCSGGCYSGCKGTRR